MMTIHLSIQADRGSLLKVSCEDLPFICKEVFTISGVPIGATRGSHAHKLSHQFLVLVQGEVDLKIIDKSGTFLVPLRNPGDFFYLPPLTWGEETFLTQDAILQVYTSHNYDPSDYILALSELEDLWAADFQKLF